MVRTLRLGVIIVTAVLLLERLLLTPLSNSQYSGFGDAFTDSAGYTFGTKVGDVFDFANGWGKFSYVVYVFLTYALIALSVIAIIGWVKDSHTSPGPSSYRAPESGMAPPGILTPIAPAPVASAAPSSYDQLERISRLRADGTLTDAEFESEKRKLLG